MKKKLLIILFAAIMICIFAFTVSAANEVTLTNGTTADLTTVFKVNSSNQVTGFNSGYTKNDVTDVIFPDEIVGLEANFLFGGATNLNTVTFAATDTFFISGDNIFTNCSVKTVTFNPNCVVELRKGNFADCAKLTQITFPKFAKLAGSAFKGCSNMVATNELILEEGMTDIGGHAFNGCKLLKGTVYFPSSLLTIQEYSFENTGFEYFDLSKCASLNAVGGGYGGPFTNNDSITVLDLSGCTSLKELKGSFAQGCDNLTEVILPPNLENIPYKAFAHCYKLQSIVFPASLKYVADEAFHSARSGQDVKTFTVYIQSNVEFHATYSFRDSGAKIEFVLIGDGVTLESFLAANTYSAIKNATIVDYLDPASPWTYTVGQKISAHTIVTNYCSALAITGEHLSNANPCVINCSSCGLSNVKDNPEHNEAVTIVYNNGYDNVGIILTMCTNEGCPHKKTEEAVAIFSYLGLSASEFDEGGITMGFTVNKDAIADFERISGKTLDYGVFAVSQSKLGENDIFDENGNAANGVISVELTKYEFLVFDLKLVGFNVENEHKKFAMGAYIQVTDGETNEHSFLQEKDPDDGEKYYFASFTEMMEG